MNLTTIIGAAIGSAIDGSDGEDSTVDGAIAGAATAVVVRTLLPIAITFTVGWLVLRGVGKLKDKAFGTDAPAK